jgi:ABC-2 type transport system ATP-binding protein
MGPAADTDAVAVTGLHVSRGGREVLHGVGVRLAPGTVTGLLGPSGCGKTTLMRALVGVQRLDAGAVRVLGRSAGDPALRTEVGYMTQAPSVYGDLTVAQNLRYFAAILSAPPARVGEVLETVALADAADRVVATMSGGERARVSLASALVGAPRLLVLDEPTVGLDPVLRRDLWGTFRRLAGAGATLLVSSHVMDEAAQCDALVLMRDGRVVGDGPLDALLERTGARDVEQAFLRIVEGGA